MNTGIFRIDLTKSHHNVAWKPQWRWWWRHSLGRQTKWWGENYFLCQTKWWRTTWACTHLLSSLQIPQAKEDCRVYYSCCFKRTYLLQRLWAPGTLGLVARSPLNEWMKPKLSRPFINGTYRTNATVPQAPQPLTPSRSTDFVPKSGTRKTVSQEGIPPLSAITL